MAIFGLKLYSNDLSPNDYGYWLEVVAANCLMIQGIACMVLLQKARPNEGLNEGVSHCKKKPTYFGSDLDLIRYL